MKAIVDCLVALFEKGDYGKIMPNLVLPLCNQIQTLSTTGLGINEERLAKIYILSKFFQRVNQSVFIGSPPSKELLDLFMKLAMKSSDAHVRAHCYQAVTRVIKSGVQSLNIHVQELVKFYTKTLDKVLSSDPSPSDHQIKVACGKGLSGLVAKIFSLPLLQQNYEALQAVCFKAFSDNFP